MPKQPTDAMRQGSLVDCMITEPEAFERRYVVAPRVDRRTKAGKEAWANAEEQARENCAQVIPQEWHANAIRIVQTLRNDPVASEYLQGQGQKPHFWHDNDHDIDCRYLPDIEHAYFGRLIDLKKTRSANPRLFAAQSYALGYDIQVAHYAEGYRDRHGDYPKQIALLAYEWNWPHNWSVNVISEDLLEEGRRRREEAMCLIKECQSVNEWPSWGVHLVDVPRWVSADDPANDTDVSDLGLEGI